METQQNGFRSKHSFFPLKFHNMYHPLKTIKAFSFILSSPNLTNELKFLHNYSNFQWDILQFLESLVWRQRIIINVLNPELDKYIEQPSECFIFMFVKSSLWDACKKLSSADYKNQCSIKDWKVKSPSSWKNLGNNWMLNWWHRVLPVENKHNAFSLCGYKYSNRNDPDKK